MQQQYRAGYGRNHHAFWPPHVLALAIGGLMITGCGKDDKPSDAQACVGGARRCAGASVELCQDERWTLGSDCGANGRICIERQGAGVCTCPPGSLDDGRDGCVQLGDGKSCAAPALLDLGAPQSFGTTVGAGDEYDSMCDGKQAEDLVYVFRLAKPRRMLFEATGFSAALSLRTRCTDAASELACDAAASHPGTNASLEASLTAGTYYLFVDGHAGSRGPFAVRISSNCGPGMIIDPESGDCAANPCEPNPCSGEHQRACAPRLPKSYSCSCDDGYLLEGSACTLDPKRTGEGCLDPSPLDPFGTALSGSTLDANDSGTGSCGNEGGPDRVYSFLVNGPTRADFVATGYDTVLHLRTDCGDVKTQVACNDNGNDAVAPGSHLEATLPAGMYFLYADSYSAGGAFAISYSLRTDPCALDPCSGTPECVAAADWSSYRCVCDPGLVAYNSSCIEDPCNAKPCLELHKSVCTPKPPSDFNCGCDPGFLPDGTGCALDPSAAKWTFMVYMNGDNNLEPFAYDDLAEMELVGSTPQVNLVVLLDSSTRDSGRSRRLLVRKGAVEVLDDLGELNMGDWRTLADFGAWAVQRYPAEHYALVLWDHGDGWRAGWQPAISRGFSNDATDGSVISVASGELAAALAAITAQSGVPLDVIGFDACLMGAWEVAEAAAPYARVLVASEEVEPAGGWFYEAFLSPLVQNASMSPEQLATSIVDSYLAGGNDSATLAALRLGTISTLATKLSTLADAFLVQPTTWSDIEAARNAAQAFNENTDDMRDLRDFCDHVASTASLPADIKTKANAVSQQLGDMLAAFGSQSSWPGAKGMSIYFPQLGSGSVESAYYGSGAVWSANGTWDEFLKAYVK